MKFIIKSFYLLALAIIIAATPITGLAAEGDTFTVSGITYRVLSESETTGTVQVGDGNNVAIHYLTAALDIPNSVSYGGKTYTVTSIGNNAMIWCHNLTSVTIPNSVTSIGRTAFYDCRNLTSITIPNSVTSIGSTAFGFCINLTGISIPNSVTSIGDHAFTNCSNLTSIIIPNRVTSIDNYTFRFCYNLKSVTIPNSVTSIGEHAFYECSSLANVIIPSSVTSIGSSAFNSCSSLTNIIIPDSVIVIDEFAFSNCTGLTSITIPNSVIKIGNGAFLGSAKLTIIDVSLTNPAYSSENGVLYNKARTLLHSFPSVTGAYTISSSVSSINGWAFYGCTSLTRVTIPNSVTSIGQCAFYECRLLTEVWFGGNAPYVWAMAFERTALGATAYVNKDASGFPAEGWGWNGLIVRYREAAITHTVTFVDWNSAVLDTQAVEHGYGAAAPTAPMREGHTFTGWDVDFSSVTGDLTVTAQYKANVYTISFYKQSQDGNNSIAKTPYATQQVAYNQLIDWTKVTAGKNAAWYITDGKTYGAKFDPATPITGDLKLAVKDQNNQGGNGNGNKQ